MTIPFSTRGCWRSPGRFTDLPTIGSRPDTIEELYDRAERTGDGAAWDQEVWNRSQLEAVFLTNDFDDPLEGWDTTKFVPCLRTDDLVLKLHERSTVDRLIRSTGVDVQDVATLQRAIGVLFERFVSRARGPARSACLPTSCRNRPARSGRQRRSAAP